MRAASSGYSQLKGETNSKELRGQGAANTVTVLNATELFTFEWSLAGTSVVVWGLRLHAPNTGGLGLIPDQGTRSHVPH